MADIFISYSSEDKTRVKILADALEHRGWSVWWDRSIPVGQRFDTVIEQELSRAKCVIVIWTHRSVQSEWVKNEASDAAQRNILAPVLLENVTLPLAFRRIEAAQLLGWTGEPDHPELTTLFKAVEAIISDRPIDAAATADDNKNETITQYIEKKKRKYLMLTGFGFITAGLLAYWYFRLLSQNSFTQNSNFLFYLLVILFGVAIAAALSGILHTILIVKAKPPGNLLKLIPAAAGITLIILCILFLPGEPQIKLIRIKGEVKTAAEIPIKDAEVSADGTRFFATSITDGTYTLLLENYRIGDEVTLTSSNKDFEDKTIAVTINSREMNIDFVLNPVTR